LKNCTSHSFKAKNLRSVKRISMALNEKLLYYNQHNMWEQLKN
jgi:hypothetical protein